jgi:hypothetical protein
LSRRKAILATFTLLALISLGGGILVDVYFSEHSPTSPRPVDGQTHPVISNKVRVYLTRQELVIFYLPSFSFFVWFAAIAYFGVRWRLMKVAMKQPEFGFPVAKKKNDDG